jgi:hypothetical protein
MRSPAENHQQNLLERRGFWAPRKEVVLKEKRREEDKALKHSGVLA